MFASCSRSTHVHTILYIPKLTVIYPEIRTELPIARCSAITALEAVVELLHYQLPDGSFDVDRF